MRYALYLLGVFTTVVGGKTSADEPPPKELPYVEFDLNTLPDRPAVRVTLTYRVMTTDKDLVFKHTLTTQEPPRGAPPPLPGQFAEMQAEIMADQLTRQRFRADLIGKTIIRVYGRNFNDKLIPAVKGEVTSPEIAKEFLPKVTNPKTKA